MKKVELIPMLFSILAIFKASSSEESTSCLNMMSFDEEFIKLVKL